MVTVNVIGGLGNQMFQYAFGRALALRHGYEFNLDVTDFGWYRTHEGFQLEALGVRCKLATERQLAQLLGWRHRRWARRLRMYKRFPRRNTVVEPHFEFSARLLRAPDDCYFVGYWHSNRYFNDQAQQLRTDFVSADVDLSVYGDLPSEIASTESVAVHVRRGDYTTTVRGRNTFVPCGKPYYKKAVDLIRGRVSNPKFFVFSDEPSAVTHEQLIDTSHRLVNVQPRPPAYVELRLMMLCKHFVIANSSFSWWAAWLGDNPTKRVVAPRNWFADGSRDTRDLLPKDWILV
jgi:hypothetical protein